MTLGLGRIIRHWFDKGEGVVDALEAERRNRSRYNALWMLDPDVLVRHLNAFDGGDICGLERVVEAFEKRDDKMRIGAFKMAAAVSAKPWEVRINKGEEDNPKARLHQETLEKFWNRVEATDAFCRNLRGGLRLLVKQMMSAQSRVYSVHDVTWTVLPGGELKATFVHMPAWSFENRTGSLRYIRNDGEWNGEEMRDGEWLVTVGEGVGITATILAMAKRLSWNDWLLFSEKCGMPVVLGNTDAQRGTPAWDAMAKAIRAVAPKTGLLADLNTKLQAVSMGGASAQSTYRELIDTVDRAISTLYRGGDLATQSSAPDAAGVNAQDGESELMDGVGCAMVSEALHNQIERHVIRFTCGDFEPLAGIYIGEPEKESVDTDMKIDSHLAGLGVRLSKKDALQRYGRVEATDEKDALSLPDQVPSAAADSRQLTAQDIASLIYPLRAGGYKISRPVVERATGLKLEELAPEAGVEKPMVNEKKDKTPLQNDENRLQNAPHNPDGQGDPSDKTPSQNANLGPNNQLKILEAFAKDNSPAAKAVAALLQNPGKEAAEQLLKDLPTLLPKDPDLAAVIADAMAAEFATALSENHN